MAVSLHVLIGLVIRLRETIKTIFWARSVGGNKMSDSPIAQLACEVIAV
jgi:hypothetical protein